MNGMKWAPSLSAYGNQHYFPLMLSGVATTYAHDYVYDRGSKWYNLIACISLFGVAWCDMYTYDLWKHYVWAAIFFGNTHISMVYRAKGLMSKIYTGGVVILLIGLLFISFIHPNILSLHDAEWINMIPMALLLAIGSNEASYLEVFKSYVKNKIITLRK